MTTQDYLKQIRRFKSMAEHKQYEVSRLDAMVHGVKPILLDPNKVQTSMKGDKMAESVAELIDAQKKLKATIKMYLTMKEHIIKQIDKMPNHISYEVLTDRYVENRPYYETACRLNYSERWVKKAHARALKEFETLYGEEYLDNPTIFS